MWQQWYAIQDLSENIHAALIETPSSHCSSSRASSVFPCTKAWQLALSQSPSSSHFPHICPLVVHAPLSPLRQWEWDTWANATHPWGRLISPVIEHTVHRARVLAGARVCAMMYIFHDFFFLSWGNDIFQSSSPAVIIPCPILADISQAQLLWRQQ